MVAKEELDPQDVRDQPAEMVLMAPRENKERGEL